ncbi:MAG: 3-phosphoshikimate 1-carboxyvinyltransferase [Eubacterium sp.]|jgi:3-phosphoshikimate 1-carboxyvinyltransferase|nr:3-phosphoshikimate 1-carboxyvinyltransferase [Eubacterium sp.]
MIIKPAHSLKGEIHIPGDKSISHRSVMFGALANGMTEVTHFLQGADCLSTISCFQKLGIPIENTNGCIRIQGKGLHGLRPPACVLDVGNSGTTMRLLSGILAGQPFSSTLNGDASIQKRPMKRIITPLREMGAAVSGADGTDCAPLFINGAPLHGIDYQSPVASAQVKSCILLAGLYADTKTSVTEPSLSRNHTELMLRSFGAEITCSDTTATILPDAVLTGQKIDVPGDISSAAYFIAAALLVPNAEVLIHNVGVNPTRDGILRAAKAMNADITRLNEHQVSGEPVCDLLVRSSSLTATTVEGSLIPALIDEIPVLAVLAAYANGTTVIRDAAELKVKESNRIETIVSNLKKMGADVEATEDGMVIYGGKPLHFAEIDPHADHRIAMAFAVAALCAQGGAEILNAECASVSYPSFYKDLQSLYAK